ncbi:TIGR02679 family protein [Streptomyces sp. B-S-A8]|uniref:TIGR02679 family protein n=1 Tax=Streptomyces solicavernae TaxID=3043614 RepID=A0ABT6RPD6_9ACTN|nr:TIGR02679 family protein [Streptomyces sp. B-S-A8]MDI3386296.1 TIGR02679 family protein [Streptomyces sp. B-S-A8]
MELTAGTGAAPVDAVRLRRLLGVPEFAWLVERVRRRLAAEQPLTGAVTLTRPTPDQRRAAERLLGRVPGGGRSLTVRLEAVDAVLRRSGISPDGLAEAITALTGPVTLLGAARRAEEDAWQEAFAPVDELAEERPALKAWVVRLRGDGLVRRLAGTPTAAGLLLSHSATVLRALPADPAVSVPAFAARVLDSAHALDDGTALATVTLSGIRALTGFPDGAGAQWRRDAWASAGLLRDELSSTVLALNLRGTPALDWMAETGEPAVLTLRQLIRRPPAPTAEVVHVCENPAVLGAAADTHGRDCSPLVCLQGQPSAAALALLQHLHEGGARLHYHGDFDWGGLRIASVLLRRVPWHPWRFTTAEYRAAALRGPTGPPLTGRPAEAPWDPELSAALMELGIRVEEETVLDELLSDLV